MLSKAIIFSFSFLGMFAILFVNIPNSFRTNQATWSSSYYRTDEQVATFFNFNNITVYDSQAQGLLTYPEHDTVIGGLPSGQQLDVWWDLEYATEDPHDLPGPYSEYLGISYETQHWFLGVFQYWTAERLHFSSLKAGVNRGDFVYKTELEDDFQNTLNGTGYSARCNSGIQVSILYSGNETDIGDSWDNGQLSYMISWELNATASSINMFTLLGQILTFQAPTLGITGFFGDLMNAMIAIPIYALTGFLIYKLITGIAPWLSGGSGD